MATGRPLNVAVVGAGISGLRCSDILARSGVKVTLFEARDRIGGRVHQMESGGYLMDMGANWIHGTANNPIMQLAEKTGTVVVEPEEQQALYDTKGIRRQDAEAVDLSSKMWEMIVDAFKYSDEHSAEISPQVSLFEYFESKLDEEKSIDRRKREDVLQEAQMWGPFVGDSVEKQSLKFFFLEECIEGENIFVASTYREVLREIGRTAMNREKVDLRLSTPIAHFDFDSSCHVADGSQTTVPGYHKVTLRTSTGDQSSFDEVLVTCPLGWLKQNHTKAFTPSLPSRLSEAISNIGYGRLEKLYVTFPSAFWLSKTVDEVNPIKDTSSYPIFTHFHDPSYIPHPENEAWNQSVVSLAHLPKPHDHPTLLYYMYGPCGTHLVDATKSLDAHSEAYNNILDTFALPFYSRLPNYSIANSDCKPTSFLMTQWQADSFAGNGSYSNFQVGLGRGDEDIECLRDAGGLWKKGLWFAGEHTAPFIALGTTTGAWWSGEAVAKRICKIHGIEVVGDVAHVDDEVTGINGIVVKKKGLDKETMDGANLSGLAI